MRTILLTILLTSALTGHGQNRVEIDLIYRAALRTFFEGRSAGLALVDSTSDNYIIGTNYLVILYQLEHDTTIMNPSWSQELKKAELLKQKLTAKKIPHLLEHGLFIQFADKTTIQNSGWEARRTGFFKRFKEIPTIQLSNIIFLENKAIVELQAYSEQSGRGMLYFMEEQHGKWVVAWSLRTWANENHNSTSIGNLWE